MRIYLSPPHMGGREQAYVTEAFESGFIAPAGPQLSAFERRVADYLGGGLHCVALSSGSAALHLALRIAGIGPGDEVWVSSMTFAGGVFPALYQGAEPVFFDLSRDSWTMCADLIEEELERANRQNRLPGAIVPTDLYGQGVDLSRLEAAAARYGVPLLVDSAESLGATHPGGQKCGSGGDAAVLSFNGNKIITTSGGGMLVTCHDDWAREARFLATQARDPAPHYEHSTYGYNYRMSNITAAIGLGQMDVLDAHAVLRRDHFGRYRAALRRDGVAFMPETPESFSTRWLTVMTVDPDISGTTREQIRLALLEQEIESRPMWKPMHLQPLFSQARYVGSGWDETLFTNGLCLPSGSSLSVAEQAEVIGHIEDVLKTTGAG